MKINQVLTHAITLEIFTRKEDAYRVHTQMLLTLQEAGQYSSATYSVATNNYDSSHTIYKYVNVFDLLDEVYNHYTSNQGIYFRYYVEGLDSDELELLQSSLTVLEYSVESQ